MMAKLSQEHAERHVVKVSRCLKMAEKFVVDRIRRSDVLIWDEASMSRQHMLELVNAIHHCLSESQCNRPFAGKQVILVGEWLQLRPIPNDLVYLCSIRQYSKAP